MVDLEVGVKRVIQLRKINTGRVHLKGFYSRSLGVANEEIE